MPSSRPARSTAALVATRRADRERRWQVCFVDGTSIGRLLVLDLCDTLPRVTFREAYDAWMREQSPHRRRGGQLNPPHVRLHFVLDNFSPHKGEQMRECAQVNNVELAYTPFYASWLNRIEAQFRALRYFTLAGTDHPDHATQARLIRRYIAWRNNNIQNPRLRVLINTANVA
jgi:transposase